MPPPSPTPCPPPPPRPCLAHPWHSPSHLTASASVGSEEVRVSVCPEHSLGAKARSGRRAQWDQRGAEAQGAGKSREGAAVSFRRLAQQSKSCKCIPPSRLSSPLIIHFEIKTKGIKTTDTCKCGIILQSRLEGGKELFRVSLSKTNCLLQDPLHPGRGGRCTFVFLFPPAGTGCLSPSHSPLSLSISSTFTTPPAPHPLQPPALLPGPDARRDTKFLSLTNTQAAEGIRIWPQLNI